MQLESANDFFNVRMFHMKFGQPTDVGMGEAAYPVGLMPADQFDFRRRFLLEELDEYGVAYNKGNLVKAADALFDLVYVVFGTALFMRAGPNFFTTMPWPTFVRVRDQADRFGYLKGVPPTPQLLPREMHDIIHRRISFELELFFACHEKSFTNFSLSHLWNVAYAAYLGAALMNVPWDNCWRHVQEANMSKVRAMKDGSDSTRQSSWDVVKPAGWSAPDEKIAMELTLAGATLDPDAIEEARRASIPKGTPPAAAATVAA